MSEEKKDCIIQLNTFTLRKNEKDETYDDVYFIIYKTENLLKCCDDENRFYVGQHVQINKNPQEFDGYFGSGTILEQSLKIYGEENFKRETLEICNVEIELDSKEIFWIKYFKANKRYYPNDGGMNLTNGGLVLRYNSKNNPMLGKTHTNESKEKMSLNNAMNKKEYRDKISESLSKLELKQSDEKKEFLRQFNTGIKRTKYEYFLSNGKNYWEFFSAKEKEKIKDKFKNQKGKTKIIFNNIEIERIRKNEM